MCISRDNLHLLDDTHCVVEDQPIGSVLCDNKECPVIASWHVGPWSKVCISIQQNI